MNLVYNELVKQFKKPSIKIIYSLILIIAIVLPIGINKMPQDISSKHNLEAVQFQLQDAERELEDYKNDKTVKGKILYRYAQIRKEEAKLNVDHKIGYDGWRAKQLEILSDKSYELAAVDFILQGFDKGEISKHLINTDSEKVETYYKLNTSKLKEEQSKLQSEVEKCKKIIETNDHVAYTQEEINANNALIEYHKEKIEKNNKLKPKNPKTEEQKETLKGLEKDINTSERIINNLQIQMKVVQFRVDNKIDYNPNNWKNNSIKTIEKELSKIFNESIMTENDYYASAKMNGYEMSYDEYVKHFEKTQNNRINNIKKLWYGLEKNIPDLSDIADARSVLDKTYEIFIILSVIMVIVVAGGIVSSEYSKGTIRLLLIRPVSRYKILLAKFVAVLVVGFSIAILGIGISYVSSGMVFGFETYKTPILEVVNGAIVQKSFMSTLLPKIVVSSSSLVFMSSLVFAMSTLSKNTSLSVAVSMIVYGCSAFATALLVSFKQSWIVYTLIPYINASYFRLIPTVPEALENGFGIQMQYTQGAIQLIVASLIMLAITFITFTKKDVKN